MTSGLYGVLEAEGMFLFFVDCHFPRVVDS